MTNKSFVKIAAFSIAISILFGAFGAHALKEHFSSYYMDIWNKGIFYQIINSLGIIALVLLEKSDFVKKIKVCCILLLIGVVFFSGSLYTIAIMKTFYTEVDSVVKLMIPITPLGGTMLIVGWMLVPFKVK